MFKHNGRTKIGISKNSLKREKEIESTMQDGANIRLVFQIKICNAIINEKHLHYIYREKWSPLVQSSGRLEWFDLSWFDRQRIRLKMWAVWVIQSLQNLILNFVVVMVVIVLVKFFFDNV